MTQPGIRFPNEWLLWTDHSVNHKLKQQVQSDSRIYYFSETDLLVNYRQNVTGTVKLTNEWLLRVQSFNESNESKQMILMSRFILVNQNSADNVVQTII